MTRFSDYHFDETFFSTLEGETKHVVKEISWNELSLPHHDPRMKQCEHEIQR